MAECREPAYVVPPVRMGMGAAEAEIIAALYDSVPVAVFDQVMDQLWLRSVFVEQRKRTNVSERVEFDRRANRILEQIDPRMEPVE